MKRMLLACLLCTVGARVQAAEIVSLTTDRDGVLYHLHIEAVISAPLASVRRVISDYVNLPLINPALREAKVLDAGPPARVRFVTETCFWLFCLKVIHVQDFREDPGGLYAEIVSELSDFHSGWVDWRMQEWVGGSRIVVTIQVEPDFTIPPLIGPYLLRKTMEEIASDTIVGLEQAALQDSEQRGHE